MDASLLSLYEKATQHQKEHGCGSVPYQQRELLAEYAKNAKRILEIGTGIGYSAACMALANPQAIIHSIDKDHEHLILAKEDWKALGITTITAFEGKAHEVIAAFKDPYDLIFFDGYTPQRKFLPDFERLLTTKGILLTANLFLNNATGGKYLQLLQDTSKWQTTIIGDTAISIKQYIRC